MRAILNLTLSLLVLLAAGGCGRPSDQGAAGRRGQGVPVEVATATTTRVEQVVSAIGTLEADEIVQVKPEQEGRIVAVTFNEGDPVKRGDVLFRLDDAKLKAAVDAAAARATKARNNLERGRRLLEQQTISHQEFDDFQAESQDAQAMLVLAQEQLDDATVVSPLDGFISERQVSAGQVVEKDRELVTVVANDPIKIDFSVPERYLGQLQRGQAARVTTTGLPDRVFVGEVYFIDPQLDPSTRTIKLKARIPNPDNELRAGMFASVKLTTGVRENAVVIPEQAVVPVIDKLVVFVVENGQAFRREIAIGMRLRGGVEIVRGLQAGEVVVSSGQQRLQDGVPVKPIEPAPAATPTAADQPQ